MLVITETLKKKTLHVPYPVYKKWSSIYIYFESEHCMLDFEHMVHMPEQAEGFPL